MGRGESTIGSIELKKQRLQLIVTSATKITNNEHDCLDYGYASLDGLVSPNRLSVGCGTTPKRQTGDLTAFECYPCGLHIAATSRILANRAVIPI